MTRSTMSPKWTTTNFYLFGQFPVCPKQHFISLTQPINALQPLYKLTNKQLIIGQRYSSPPFWNSKERTVSSVSCLHPPVRPSVSRHAIKCRYQAHSSVNNNTPLEKLPSSCLLILSPQHVRLIGRTQEHTWNMTGKSRRCYYMNSSRSYVTRINFTRDEKEILLQNRCEDGLTQLLSHNNFFGPPKQGRTA